MTLNEAWERKHYPRDLRGPIETLKFRMEQLRLTPRDLVPMVGRVNRVYEVLAHKRSLTLPMIWRLIVELGIPAESLIRPPTEHRDAGDP